jgi:light-harvesting complex I chlorophyll a/b binding protein 1
VSHVPNTVQATPQSIGRLAEGEVINGRWAMAACVGCLSVELLGFGNWFDAPLWAVNGTAPTYFGVTVPFGITTIILVETVLMAGAELLRGSQEDPVKRIYPGIPPSLLKLFVHTHTHTHTHTHVLAWLWN